MSKFTKQMKEWTGDFGKEYTDRNTLSLEGLELLYKECYGITRSKMNSEFIGDIDRAVKVLEVGTNTGEQLLCLQKAGFKYLYGIELQSYAIDLSKSRMKGINVIQGSALDIPFKTSSFDLVFTSGVLIHIAPDDISRVMDEMYRCTRQYIWGFEYYSDAYTRVPYRGYTNLMWKADFSKLFLDRFRDLRLVKSRHYKYGSNDNIDVMFLLQKVEHR